MNEDPRIGRALVVLGDLRHQKDPLSPGQVRLRAQATEIVRGEDAARVFWMEAAEAGDREAIHLLNQRYGEGT
jgi:hypothetical protein